MQSVPFPAPFSRVLNPRWGCWPNFPFWNASGQTSQFFLINQAPPPEVPQSLKAWECGQSWLPCLGPVCSMSWQPIRWSLKSGLGAEFCSLPPKSAFGPGKCCNRVFLQSFPRDSSSWIWGERHSRAVFLGFFFFFSLVEDCIFQIICLHKCVQAFNLFLIWTQGQGLLLLQPCVDTLSL